MDCRMPLAKEEKTSGKANNLLLSFFLRVYLKSRKYRLFLQTQREFERGAAAAEAVLKPLGENCAVLP